MPEQQHLYHRNQKKKKPIPSRLNRKPSIKPFNIFPPSIRGDGGHKIWNQITARSSLGHNYAWQVRTYGSTIYRRPSTPVHPRAAPKENRTATERVSAIYFISGTLKSVFDRRHRRFPWNTGRAVDFVGRIVSRKEGCHRVARDSGAPAA